jgi:hypothetical protein
VFKAMGDLTLSGGTKVTHAAGATVVSGGNAAAVIGLDTIKLANVQSVGGYSNDYIASGNAFGKIGDNVLVKGSIGNEVFTGSSVVDAFFFDTKSNIRFGDDTLRSFGTEDRLVTTTKLSDPDGDGRALANSSDRFTFTGGDGKDTGSFKLFVDTTNKAVSQLKLLNTVTENGVANYVYGLAAATGDGSAVTKLLDAAFKILSPGAIVSPTTGTAAPAMGSTVNHVPTGAILATAANDTLNGTAAKDVFFFDTVNGTASGYDTIKGFGAGDRIVTTSKLADPNNDGKISFNSSDKLVLAGADATDSVGTLKMFYSSGKAVSNLDLADTVIDHGQTYYVYSSHADTTSGAGLHFA